MKYVKCEGIDEAVKRFVAAVQKLDNEVHAERFKNVTPPEYSAREDRRYFSVWVKKMNGQQPIFAFIEKTTGDIFKPASWRAPAEHARGNVFSESHGMESIDKGYVCVRYLKGI